MNATPINPIEALFWSAVINGVVAVPIMILMMILSSRRAVMGAVRARGRSQDLRLAGDGGHGGGAIGMFATWGE